jgi:hypothetical protein
MNNRDGLILFLLLLVVGPAGLVAASDIPTVPYVEASFATAGPLSLFCSPDGGGHPFTQAFTAQGDRVDGTLSIILYSDMPPWGDPVPNYPAEDIFLVDRVGDLAPCNGGTIPDHDTDAEGRTRWTNPLRTGGHVEPGDENQVTFFVNGWYLDPPSLLDFHLNSPDLNGDGAVNLIDFSIFSENYFGLYDYAYDFRWDGTINLSDLAFFSQSYGSECP